MPLLLDEKYVTLNHSRRKMLRQTTGMGLGLIGGAIFSTGCVPQADAGYRPDLVWGRRGISDGRFLKPRAMVCSPEDELYIVDKTGRIQVFDSDGNFRRSWRTPEIKQGKPTGLGWSQDGHLLVADTHYFRVLFYWPDGTLDESLVIGGEHGDEPGQFHFVTDVAQNDDGHYFVGQYGQIDRIQEFDAKGNFLRRWGSQGSQLEQFSRPQALIFDDQGLLWIADACNHRIQVFDVSTDPPKLVKHWGRPGSENGHLQYPYGLDFDVDGSLWISEYGNHRVQQFSREGEARQVFGSAGQEPGQLLSPWALHFDGSGRLHVLDSLNHRVQRFRLS